MPEVGGAQPPELPEPEEIIQGVSRELGLNPDREPTWGYGPPVEAIYPEEAPTLLARKQARHALGRLHYFLEWRLWVDEPTVTAKDLKSAYRIVQDEMKVENDTEFDLSHVLGAAKRTAAFVEELRQYREATLPDEGLKVLHRLRDLLEETVHPGEARLVKDIEEQIRHYVRQAYPPQQQHPLYEAYRTMLTAPYLEEHFRSYLTHTPIRLLPEEADTPLARDAATWCHEFLFDRVGEAREAGLALTPQDVEAHYGWYREQKRQWPDQDQVWRDADFSLGNVLGSTKRRLLYWHSIRDKEMDYQQRYYDTLAVYNLVNRAVNPDAQDVSQAANEEDDHEETQDRYEPDDVPF